ncbi:signal peptide protein [Burkholderia alba]|uniref:signal peptide protein n=1 Tax=Burkholderia alba TaxID=2683677 RepID=UPI002B05B02D|nr:signal peptide protein [Burkholderia alba]
MPILIVFLILAALIWGAVYAFHSIAARFGEAAAIGAAVVAAAVVIALIAWWLRRRRDIAPNTREDGWTHLLRHGWGELRVSATKGLLWVSQDGAEGRYTLTDLNGCAAEAANDAWYLVVKVRDAHRAEWKLPMTGKRDAQRWERVLTLAKAQRL